MAGTKRARGGQFKFPNPAKRSKADPAVVVDSRKVLGLYNAATGENAKYVTDKVEKWIDDTAKAKGWDEVEFIGGQGILKMNF